MRSSVYITSTLAFLVVLMAGCDGITKDCDNPSGDMICVDGDYIEVNYEFWNNDSGYVNLQVARALLPGIDGPGFTSSMTIFPASGSTVPEVGTYTFAPTVVTPTSANMFTGSMGLYEGDEQNPTITFYDVDTSAASILEITAFTNNTVSGYFTCRAAEKGNPVNKRDVKVYFEEAPRQ